MYGRLVGKGRVKCETCSPLNVVESVVRPWEGEAIADDANANGLAPVIAHRLQRLQHSRLKLPPLVEKRHAPIVERWKEDRAVPMPGGRRDDNNSQSGQGLTTQSSTAENAHIVRTHEPGRFQQGHSDVIRGVLEAIERTSEGPEGSRHKGDAANPPESFVQAKPAMDAVDHVPSPVWGSRCRPGALGREGRATRSRSTPRAGRRRPLPAGGARSLRPRYDDRDDA